MGVSMPTTTGWVGIGFPTSPGQMVGSTAVIATTSATNGIGIYDLASTDISGVTQSSGALSHLTANGPPELSKVRPTSTFWHLLQASSYFWHSLQATAGMHAAFTIPPAC